MKRETVMDIILNNSLGFTFKKPKNSTGVSNSCVLHMQFFHITMLSSRVIAPL